VRLFVGVELDAEVASAAGELVRTLRGRAQLLAPQARVAWIPEARMHLTVRFIGSADDALAAAIRDALRQPLHVSAFPLDLEGVGAFPRAGTPKVLWAGLTSGLPHLVEIEREITRRLLTAGVPPEDRPYRPHLTLARVKEPSGLRTGRLFDGLEGTRLGTTHVEAITLFESRLSPNGPTYVPLLRTPLEPPD